MQLQKSFSDVSSPDDLSDTTIVVIGLWHMGVSRFRDIAEVLNVVDVRPLKRLMRNLRTSKNPVVRRSVDVGLPPGVCRPLPWEGTEVYCCLCGMRVTQVPCPVCSLKPTRRVKEEPAVIDRRRPTEPIPTSAKPGTFEKVNVMRGRVLAGQAVFHPADATW
jgi:hypothetical protein